MKKALILSIVLLAGITCRAQKAVNLGLSVKWSDRNVGAAVSSEKGDPFVWGESVTDTTSTWWPQYKYCEGRQYSITKYCVDPEDGTVDGKTVLEPSDDVASLKWGGKWRMPTEEEWTELMEKCKWTWTVRDSIPGYLVTGPNKKSIFLPSHGDHSWYWSSTLGRDFSDEACRLDFSASSFVLNESVRCRRHYVRPVWGPAPKVPERLAARDEESETETGPIVIKGREVLWDEFLTEECTASKLLHSPIYREPMLKFDMPWENNASYFSLVHDEAAGEYYMYYCASHYSAIEGKRQEHFCVVKSFDGLHWSRPVINEVEVDGSKANNVVAGKENLPDLKTMDNFFVTLDTNPACPPEERFKVVMMYDDVWLGKGICLALLVSGDGVHFNLKSKVAGRGTFDSLNTIMWHEATGRYVSFFRNFHPTRETAKYKDEDQVRLRDVRVTFSKDLYEWTRPRLINIDSEAEYQLYTNGACVYPYAPHMIYALPTRYVERQEWTDNYDGLCGREERLGRMEKEKRYGLAITDCLFMCSRDGMNWHRFDEAFLRPGPENPRNWVYGSCYPCVGMAESPSEISGGDPLLNIYVPRRSVGEEFKVLDRYVMRKDGFVSLHSGVEETHLLTKPFIFTGKRMKLNFSTSAAGHVYITLMTDDGWKTRTCELFGDNTDRYVTFDKSLEEVAGKPVRMLIELSDADVYAFEFTD